jgi:hypothetical protein
VTTTATASSAVGTYAITASGAVSSNYTISYVAGTLTVTRATLTVTANNATKAYGAANPALTMSYGGFVNGDTAASLTTAPTVSTTATAASAVGTYAITASGAVSANYTFSYVNGTLTVTPVPLTVTADNRTKTYGAANPPLTVSYSGFVNGDTAASLTMPPSVSTTATTGSPVGTYPITASGAVSANYTIGYVSGTLTVAPAVTPSLTIANASVIPGNGGCITTPMPFTVTLSAASSQTVTLNYQTLNGTASGVSTCTSKSKGYITASGTLTFAPGETSKIITIQIIGVAVSTTQTLDVQLSNAINATIARADAIGAIMQ